jgi:hypothetical protein
MAEKATINDQIRIEDTGVVLNSKLYQNLLTMVPSNDCFIYGSNGRILRN